MTECRKINELLFGDNLTLIVRLKSIKECPDGTYACVLSDKSGEIDGCIRCNFDVNEIKSQINGAVKVSAVVRSGAERKKVLSIKEISIPEKSEYKNSDLYDGLSEEKISEYISLIRNLQRHIKHPGYLKLVMCALTDATLEKLSQMPATVNYHGKYKGGALASTAVVTEMIKNVGCTYVTHYNGLHQGNINWSLVLTASLLQAIGVIDYITPEPPFVKTPSGMERGYMSVLQSTIDRIVFKNNIEIEDLDLAKLLNVLGCAMTAKTAVKATSKEGILLRHMVALYGELDSLDYGIAEETDEHRDRYFYSQPLHRYISQY